jgi:phosphoribosylamine---glycine ligase
MKIALTSYSGSGAWFLLKFMQEGHKVDYFHSKPEWARVLNGIVPTPKIISPDRRKSLDNFQADLPDYSKYDLSVFDTTGREKQADHSLSLCPTIGDGSVHSWMEDKRADGIRLMESAGIAVPPYQEFTDINEAKAFVKKTGKRYVFKPDGGQDQNCETTYVAKDAEDLLKYFEKLSKLSKGSPFILQEFIKGVECSLEGWFNGEDFYCLNATIEEKKFMNDNIGPNTGCSGNLLFTVSYGSRLYKSGLAKMKEPLKQMGFRGMIDLNTIITDTDAYGLEWTPRFGYDASATFLNMYGGSYTELLHRVATGKVPEQSWNAEYGASVRLTSPPYPWDMRVPKHDGVPITGIDPGNIDELLRTYLYDARLDGKQLVMAGLTGLVACPVTTGSSISEAFGKLDDRVKQIQFPDMQYRTDIQKSTGKRYLEVDKMGWL